MKVFKLNYSRSNVIRTRTIILDALIGVIQIGLRNETEWNVKVIMAMSNEDPSTNGRQKTRRSHKIRRKVDIQHGDLHVLCCRYDVIVHIVQLDILTLDKIVNTMTLRKPKPICIAMHLCAPIYMKWITIIHWYPSSWNSIWKSIWNNILVANN